MTETLLSTKFFIPPTRPELVSRPRLIDNINAGLHHKLTLVSAPAGFGKSTLISEWAAGSGSSIAWLSLDEKDNDQVRFLRYAITALNACQGEESDFGAKTLNLLQSPQPLPIETVLTVLINEISEIPYRVVLVLDDYHLIEAQPIHDALSFLLDNMPLQLNLVIATRVDPPLPLARLRARDQLTELRASDLRFTRSEAAEFLNKVMGLKLTEEELSSLEARTEGWITGLQLAAISMRGSKDSTGFIKSFTGSHRYVLDYLIEEVLEQQPEEMQLFLLKTAILDRLTSSLCDFLTGQENSQRTLENLEKNNMFIVPLDNERRWYRYHRLFADLLRQRLRQTQPADLQSLNLKASEWYEKNGFFEQAIEHSLKAGDFDRTAILAETIWRDMNMSYKTVTWLGWVRAIPDEMVRARPRLSTGYGWALIDTGDLEGAELRLRDAERWLETSAKSDEQSKSPSVKKVMVNEEELRALSASIANGQAYITQARGDVQATVKYAQQALDFLPEDDYFERGLSAILPGFAFWSSGDLESAHRAISEAIANLQMLGNVPFIISFTSYLADIMIAQGHLNETKKIYLDLLNLAAEHGDPELPETAVAHLGLSELYQEQGDLKSAKRHWMRGDELGEQPAFPPWYRHWICAQVRIKRSEGELDRIIEILNKAEQLYYRHPIPDVRPLKALIARAWLAQGRLAEALLWVREQNLSVDDEVSYLHEFEHLTLVKILLARYKQDREDGLIDGAIGLLERLLKAAEDGKRMGSVIQILVQLALAYEAQDNLSKALTMLEQALALAEPEGYVRVFVDEGAQMEVLLKKLALAPTRLREYAGKLLGAFGEKEQRPPSDPPLIDPLSEREIEVLDLIAEGLTNQEIGNRLYLSLNTVKVHTRNIYSKLDVSNRTQAVAQGRALGILSLD